MKPVRYTKTLVNKYLREGFWTNDTIESFWEKNAALFPEKEAIVDSTRRLTWRQAKDEIDILAAGSVAMGIARDEVVVGQVANIIESVTLRLAMEKAGVLYLPGVLSWREDEIEHIFRTLKAKAAVIPWSYDGVNFGDMYGNLKSRLPDLKKLIYWDDKAPPDALTLAKMTVKNHLKLLAEVKKRTFSSVETSSINATSGTTGLPKLVESVSAATVLFGKVVAARLKITREDIVASIGPVHWGPGVGAVYSGAAQHAAKIVLLEKFNPEEALDLIEREKVTVAAGSTAQLIAMVRSPAFKKEKLASLRTFYWAGAPLPYPIVQEVEGKTSCLLTSAYGAMDAGYFACSGVDDSGLVRSLTVGKPLDGNECVIVNTRGKKVPGGETGEIWFRGACCFPGYYRDEEAVKRGWGVRGVRGWYRTGDVGQMDSEGNLRVLGRIKDVINVEGKPVYPAEIENTLLAHQDVYNVAVVSLPRGEGAVPLAYVIPKPGRDFTFDKMSAYLREQGMADYKIPHRLEIKKNFPMSGDGLKVSKKDLEEQAKKQ
ncbi:MAG: class I adenylate-forming enzyme family protein [Dehalococcoidia bacterium]|nr:class I adenylate-forming enzyme family protein [Dehalococcoidia bacterium]MDZ4246994.1 class I adenylate-forming enzyme family protein [Dehalococcoidia bacterium]